MESLDRFIPFYGSLRARRLFEREERVIMGAFALPITQAGKLNNGPDGGQTKVELLRPWVLGGLKACSSGK